MTTSWQLRAEEGSRRGIGEKPVELGVARFLLVEEGIKAAGLASDIVREGRRIKQMAEP
jgi:hypothetical protein